MTEPQIVYVTYIVSTPEIVWDALTSPQLSKQYFFGRSIEVECRAGAPFILRMDDGRIDSRGKVIACDPPRLLSVTWRVEWLEQFRHLPEAVVTFQLEPVGNVVRLTLSQTHREPVDEKILEGGRNGWPMILSGLKTLLETGRALQIPLPEPP